MAIVSTDKVDLSENKFIREREENIQILNVYKPINIYTLNVKLKLIGLKRKKKSHNYIYVYI